MQSINLQIAPGAVNPVINVSQNDVGRQFQLKLYDGAAAYTLPTGTTASIEGIKPDGHAFSYSDAVSVSGSILTVTTKLQMTVVAGRVICEIRLRKSGLDLGSLNFVMLVEESPINENVDPSDTEIPAIIELAEGQVEDAEAWARGTKNGEPVPSTDPQFQNNAKWYAEHVAASLDALSNVNISSPVNEDILEYNSTTHKWKNSGAVRQLKQALSDESQLRAEFGAYNIIPREAVTYIGVTTGVLYEDGVATLEAKAEGTGYSEIYLSIRGNKDFFLPNGRYKLSGALSSNIYLGTGYTNKDGQYNSYGRDNGNGLTFTVNGCNLRDDGAYLTLWLGVGDIAIAEITKVYPVLCSALDTATGFKAPTKTNRQLTVDKAETKDLSNIIATGTINGTGATIVKGKYFYLNGALCRALADIAVNATFTKNTNYEIVTAGGLNKISSDVDSLMNIHGTNSIGFHNSIYRGKDLGSFVTAAQFNAISDGTFDDLFIGDYWTINGYTFRIAAFNYWLDTGDSGHVCQTNHVVVVPDNSLAYSKMNENSPSTENGYLGSDFRAGANGNTGYATIISVIENAFGSEHILNHREWLINAVDSDGFPTNGAWTDSKAELLNEMMLYGGKIFTPGEPGHLRAFYTIDKAQLPLFTFNPHLISRSGFGYWLRDIPSRSTFAECSSNGLASYGDSYNGYSHRPVFGIIG